MASSSRLNKQSIKSLRNHDVPGSSLTRHHVATDVESVEQVGLPSVVGRNYEVGSDVVLPGML